MAEMFGAAAPKVASAFWDGFKNMSTGGQLLTAAFILNRLRFPFWAAGGGLIKVLGSGILAAGGKGLAPAGAMLGQALGRETAKSATVAGSPAKWSISDWTKAGANGKASPVAMIGRTLGTALGLAMGAYALNSFAHQFAGAGVQDILRKLNEGAHGKGAPGTQFSSDVKPTPGAIAAQKKANNGPDAALEREREKLSAGLWNNPMNANRIAEIDKEIARRKRARKKARPRATGGRTRAGETTLVGEDGPEIARVPAGTDITPNHVWSSPSRRQRPGGPGSASGGGRDRVIREQPIHLALDGSVFYKAMARQTELRTLAN
jgi:hypothetical protein